MPRKPPKPTTQRSVRYHALTYLRRYSAPRAQLRRVLLDRARRSVVEHGGDLEEIQDWIDSTLDDMERLGYVNDDAYARAKATKFRTRGLSERAIRSKLSAKGVRSEAIAAAMIATRPEGDADLMAAKTYVRKRRMGPHRTKEATPELIRKELGRLARAGFSYGVAKAALEMES